MLLILTVLFYALVEPCDSVTPCEESSGGLAIVDKKYCGVTPTRGTAVTYNYHFNDVSNPRIKWQNEIKTTEFGHPHHYLHQCESAK